MFEDFLKKQDAGTVLDIACGDGTFTKRLVENLKSYTSIIGLDMVNIRFLVSLADTGSYSSRSNDATLGR